MELVDNHEAAGPYDDLYDYFFGRLRLEIEQMREGMYEPLAAQGGINRYLFKLGDAETIDALREYVLPHARARAPVAIGDLLAFMLKRGNKKVEPSHVKLCDQTIREVNYDDMYRPSFVLCMDEDYQSCVCTQDVPPLTDLLVYASEHRIKHIVDIVLSDPEADRMNNWIKGHDKQAEGMNEDNRGLEGEFDNLVYVNYVSIRDFIVKFFGEEEYSRFMRRVKSFNDDVRRDIALGTVETPVGTQFERHKSRCASTIRKKCENYRELLAEHGMAKKDIDRIYRNYVNRRRYMALVGERDYARSYISSEWLYNIYELTDNLEQTGTVVGYLKSVEQLLFGVAMLSYRTRRVMPKEWDADKRVYTKTVPFDDTCDLDKLEMWSLINYFDPRLNRNLLDISDDSFPAFKRLLNAFRKYQRNEYLHRETIQEKPEKVSEIRNQAMLMHLIILGGCRIRSCDEAKLGIHNSFDSTAALGGISQDEAFRWLGDVLKTPHVDYMLNEGPKDVVLQIDGAAYGHPYSGNRETGTLRNWQFDLHLFEVSEGRFSSKPQLYSSREWTPLYTAMRPLKTSSLLGADSVKEWASSLFKMEPGLVELAVAYPGIHSISLLSEDLSFFHQLYKTSG